MCSSSSSGVEWKKTISETPGELVLALDDGTQMEVANRATRVAPELDMDKWRFRVRKRDGLSLESREGRDGDDVAHGELGHGGMLEGRESVISDTSCARFIYPHSLPTFLASRDRRSPNAPNSAAPRGWEQTLNRW